MHNDIGENWLLLRGLSREAAHWGDFIPIMQTRFPTARIHTLDLPGTGKLYQEESPSRIEDITLSLRQQALTLGLLDQPLTLLGLSLGGMVSWEWMLNYPEDICAAALINTSQASLNPFYQRLRWQSYPNFFKIILQPNQFQRELAIIQYVANRRDLDEQLALKWVEIQALRPVKFSNTLKQLIAAAHYKPQDKKPIPPILIMNSRGDRLVAPACSESIHQKWRLQYTSHPWAGHDLPIDDSNWVVERLQNWVEQLKQQSKIS